MKRTIPVIALCAAVLLCAYSQTVIKITGGEKPSIAVPDLRGAGQAQQFMDAFNKTLWNDLDNSGQMKMVAKTLYPTSVPQQPSDFKPPAAGRSQGPWLTDWSGPPPNANYLAFGYTAVQGNQLVLFGWLYNVQQPNTSSAQLIGKLYFGSLDEGGARKVAQEFAADILKQFGATSLMGSKVYFVSDRGPNRNKEIWSMDYDGSNQKQFTFYKTITTFPVVSPDATKIAFTTFGKRGQEILMHSLETGRKLSYYNQNVDVNAASDFTPDSQRLLIYSTAGGGLTQIYVTALDGTDIHRITNSGSIDVEAKVNPKTGADLVFISGRGGTPQLYRMSMDGSDVERLTNGIGDVANPAWNPDGQHVAFAWTSGYEPGHYNIFVMDVASRQYTQLTHDGRNENPNWAPDGVHIVFSSKRGSSTQIWSMLADGTGQQQLTNQGNNEKPVWSKATP